MKALLSENCLVGWEGYFFARLRTSHGLQKWEWVKSCINCMVNSTNLCFANVHLVLNFNPWQLPTNVWIPMQYIKNPHAVYYNFNGYFIRFPTNDSKQPKSTSKIVIASWRGQSPRRTEFWMRLADQRSLEFWWDELDFGGFWLSAVGCASCIS